MDWFRMSKERAINQLESTRAGISQQEAARRLEKYGENLIRESKSPAWWQVFFDQFKDLLVIILIVAAVISALTDNQESSIVIGIVLLLNAILGTVEHIKAEKSLSSLKELSAPAAAVMRDGQIRKESAAMLVPGDVVLLATGDLVPADGRVIVAHGLRVNESSLTGESIEIDKREEKIDGENVPLANQKNMVFSGSLVTAGRGEMLVTATGMETEIGRIAMLMNDTAEKRTPLEISLEKFSGRLAAAILAICVIIFWIDTYRGRPLIDAVMFAVALAVAAIPEALGSIVTIVQAIGTQKMARENAIIKDLKAVESLGCVSVICTDKTGTLTQNKMAVEEIWENGRSYPVSAGRNELTPLWRAALLANNTVCQQDGGKTVYQGEPLETALFQAAAKLGMPVAGVVGSYQRIRETPFDSAKKYMSVCCSGGQGELKETLLVVKGALEAVLPKCSREQLGDSRMKKILKQNDDWSSQGMRVIALAEKKLTAPDQKDAEENMDFLGMAAFMDPPRTETKASVLAAKGAGIKLVMITGDHPVTAAAIGKKVGIVEPGDLTVTGPQLDEMSREQLDDRLDKISVFARVTPEHKLRIVEAWQKKGKVTAMTGDGVNDGPALKKADIGIAMGQSGTAVSRDAADMILADDNFSTIVKAVANGRNVFRNIKNAIGFLLSGNMAGIFCALYTSFLSLPMPFLPVHLLFINLVTDSLPALAIGMEQPEEGLLKQGPRNGKAGILTVNFIKDMLIQGVLIAASTMGAFHMGLEISQAAASTMAFTTLTLARLFHGFNCRSAHSILWLGLGSNLYSIMAFEIGVLLLAAVLFVPGLQTMFAAADLSLPMLGMVILCAAFPTILIQAQKMLREGRT